MIFARIINFKRPNNNDNNKGNRCIISGWVYSNKQVQHFLSAEQKYKIFKSLNHLFSPTVSSAPGAKRPIYFNFIIH